MNPKIFATHNSAKVFTPLLTAVKFNLLLLNDTHFLWCYTLASVCYCGDKNKIFFMSAAITL